MKLLLQELQTMSIGTRLMTDTNITNNSVFNKLVSEYYSGKGIEDIFDEEIPDDLYEEE